MPSGKAAAMPITFEMPQFHCHQARSNPNRDTDTYWAARSGVFAADTERGVGCGLVCQA